MLSWQPLSLPFSKLPSPSLLACVIVDINVVMEMEGKRKKRKKINIEEED